MKIAERLRPFSHSPGVLCLLPYSAYGVQIFPCLMRLFRWDGPTPLLIGEYALSFQGPVKDFTVQCDLEKGCLRIWGESNSGFFRYQIKRDEQQNSISLYAEKVPVEGLKVANQNQSCLLQAKEQLNLLIFDTLVPLRVNVERLSLGSSKALDWDLVQRRQDATEILPVWYRLGQLVPAFAYSFVNEGALSLLHACKESIEANKPEKAVGEWLKLFQACFQGILAPFWQDHYFQGILDSSFMPSFSPLVLLSEGALLMRRHFFEQQEDHLHILPSLPPEFHSGRFLQVQAEQRGELEIEWTKKVVRRLSFYSCADQTLIFHFKKVKHFRLRQFVGQKGHIFSSGSKILLEKNRHYLFDNFH